MVSCSTLLWFRSITVLYEMSVFLLYGDTLFFSLSSLVHPAYLRDGDEDAREGATSPLHARLSTSPVAKTHAHAHAHTPPYAFLPSLTNPFLNTTMPLSSLPLSLSDLLCICKATENVLFNPSVCVSVEHPGGVRGERWERLKSEWMNVMFDL